MNRTASIDIGSTSILLLIIENGENFKTVLEKAEIAHLGENIDKTGMMKESNSRSAVNIISSYLKDCEENNVKFENIILTGTEIFRIAKNSSEFQNLIYKTFKKNILVLSGEEEAKLSYFAQIFEKDRFSEEITLIDIGGGSTEIIEGKEGTVVSNCSLKIGASRITDKFFRNDPPTDFELSKAENYILDNFKKIELKFQNNIVTGVAATVTTACSVLREIPKWNPELIHNTILKIDQIEHLIKLYKSMPLAERRNMTGLEEKRAKIILGGTLILFLFMKFFNKENLRVSVKGLRYGILLREFNKNP